jgi:hypothetical protein
VVFMASSSPTCMIIPPSLLLFSFLSTRCSLFPAEMSSGQMIMSFHFCCFFYNLECLLQRWFFACPVFLSRIHWHYGHVSFSTSFTSSPTAMLVTVLLTSDHRVTLA